MTHDTASGISPAFDHASLARWEPVVSSQRVLVQLIPVRAVVTQRLVGCSDVLQSVTSSIADVLHQRIVMIVVSHVVVTHHQVRYHGLHHVDVRTSVGRHAGAAALGFHSDLLSAFVAVAFVFLFHRHGLIGSQVEIGWIVQMSQIDHAPARLLKLNASFK